MHWFGASKALVQIFLTCALSSALLLALTHRPPSARRLLHVRLILHTPLVRAGNLHVLTILRHRAPCDVNALRLQNARDLFVSERTAGIFLIDELLHSSLQNHQRGSATFGTVHTLAEEIAQFINTLRGVHVLIGHRAAYGRR